MVLWSDGKVEHLQNIKANQVLDLNYANAKTGIQEASLPTSLFTILNHFDSIQHLENDYNDYHLEPLLPYQTSRLGGHISVGDANGDGLEDFFLGNAFGESSVLYLQKKKGAFEAVYTPFETDKDFEDLGSLFFDADADGDMDLYVVSGGNEFSRRPELLQDRLYINDNNQGFYQICCTSQNNR